MTTTPISTPSIKVEQVTPHMAAQYLGTSAGNRNLRKRAVTRYARDMALGRWVLNGEAVKFDRAGHLIDGHHRLSAVVEAKVTIAILVIRGIQEDAMLTLDTGVGRSFMDAQVVRGEHVTSTLGPVLRNWFRYEVAHMSTNIIPTHQELQEILDVHPGCIESARFVTSLKVVRSRCQPGVQGFVHAYASHKFDREMADEFMRELNDGAGLAKTNPIYLLRSRLIDLPARTRLDSFLVLALTIKAWNAWINKGVLGSLRWAPDGEHPEPFPVFKGDEAKFERARAIAKAKRVEQYTKAGKMGAAGNARAGGGRFVRNGGGTA